MSEHFEIEDDEILIDDTEEAEEPIEPRFAHVGDWVEQWFIHVVAGPYSKREVAGERTWCAKWWDHRAVVLPLAHLHQAWEAARASDDPAAMSAWWVHHAHPHIRWLCDGGSGPMYRCAKTGRHIADGIAHSSDESLEVLPAPLGWFDAPDSEEDTEEDE